MQINVVKFGQAETLDVPEGSTVAEVLEQAGIDPDATVRFRGETVEGENREILAVLAGETVVAAPPQVAHG